MAHQSLDFDVRGGIAWITINWPKSYNAIDFDAVIELLDVANRCGNDDGIRYAVLTGAGD
ncbi:MAG: enoyl-CoA hydratase/isomerase family protein [Geminicoccales bacterium]